jgi:hypothetical protein
VGDGTADDQWTVFRPEVDRTLANPTYVANVDLVSRQSNEPLDFRRLFKRMPLKADRELVLVATDRRDSEGDETGLRPGDLHRGSSESQVYRSRRRSAHRRHDIRHGPLLQFPHRVQSHAILSWVAIR